uniref:V-type proton ATPase subunit a n=1 Tax=Dunaliella tertiolecta TaxID=3047 RepID=A0A7S3QLW0_DUNTE|mmetsp:Transcript_19276/g.53976  ORF Transcript_19276/g.53976 Transcript_19276/m.53976 type:complete len:844 (+) Transcript_19276:107-2638(+)|eukprot:CAMPEP_0202345958 /NCGR_PEP_ID=MMETSP1126-20121109/4961_1 /ASSEMBLY_ACC=CAM_ASM_000457 /TAXON_ID=3047 /ORGANISM="Dunaliella tertiolecta, Strain CCMP1320" /LENGTH=843 /DNA_ID=CAMNT_0048937311 /DNA_START=82 /DNA_END=2613 /DNA_ORIENTATION=+
MGTQGEMDGVWRSENMQLVQLMIPAESAHDTVEALGDLGLLQFKDLNAEKSAFQRTYAPQVKRCEEMARKLRFFNEQVTKAGMKVAPQPVFAEQTITVDELEAKLEELEREVNLVNANNDRLQRSYSELTELQVLLERGGHFFDSARYQATQDSSTAMPTDASQDFSSPLLGPDQEAAAYVLDPKMSRLGFVAGLIQQEKLTSFERLLFRATRGNMFLKSAPVGRIQDPASGEKLEKSVFVVFFAGERARSKITKICDAYGANRYPFPEEVARQRQMHSEITSRLQELGATLDAGDIHRQSVLRNLANNLGQWSTLVRREKAIYHTLNKFSMDAGYKVLVAEAWVPSAARVRVGEALKQATERSHDTSVGTVLQPMAMTHENPPTHFKTNKFTSCFQTIVDAYGVARYREVNPTVFTIMTFPFLFAVMFGDFGHGILMLLFSLFLIIKEKSLAKSQLDDMSSMAFGGRYCILLMSLFSIYTGALYNEFFSIPMNLAGDSHFECYTPDGKPSDVTDLRDCGHAGNKVVLPSDSDPYPFGVDPAWRGTKTELPALNSMKMKMSIVVGVIHMNLGILMSLFNNQFFRDRLSTLTEFIPQVIFLNSLFGYLCFLIIYKWVSGSTADLYHVLIYMFLKPGTVDEQAYLFPGQSGVQVILLLAAFVSVPWMLLPKPLILNSRFKAVQAGRAYNQLDGDGEDEEQRLVQQPSSTDAHAEHGGHHGEHGHFDFGEVMVHQMIHTIEFVLGAVSNTASYLRLWALSLAHSQLSAVFYDRVLMASIQSNNVGAMFVGFFVWALATLAVLMIMESLSAFLHALRLHWVEFQNKFYRGDGYQFIPFTLNEKEMDM